MKFLRNAVLALCTGGLPLAACAQAPALSTFPVGASTVTVSALATNLNTVWELVWGPDNFLWMTERYGRISRVNPATGQVLPLLTLPDVTPTGESGLLGLALHPQFATSPYVYVVYNYTDAGGLKETLVRYTYSAAAGTLSAPLVLLGGIDATTSHSGSRLLVLADGTLLMTTGDAQLQPEAQNPASLNGKILRLNLDGSVPADNPTTGSRLYTLTPSSGTYTSIAAATGATNVPTVQADSGISGAIPLGFNFVFDGVTYTEVRASSNGFLSFNASAVTQTTNNLNTVAVGSRPLVAPLWDDLDGRATVGGVTNSSRANYITTGTAPNRVFTFEWQDWEWNYSSTTPVISFQAKLYEGTNVVQFVYQPGTGTVTSGSASVGLSGAASGEFLSLNNLSAAPTASSTTETTNINTLPAAGQIYTFTPPAPAACPAPRQLTSTSVTSTTATVAYTVTNTTPGPFTILYGPTGFDPTQAASTTNVYSTTTATGTSTGLTGLTPNTTYQFYVQQNCGGTAGNSTRSNAGSFTTTPTAAANNECAQAIALTVGTTCTTPYTGNAFGATQSLAATTGCGSTTANDVWYSFVATASALQLNSGAQFTGYYDVRSGTCTTSTSVTCGSLGTIASPSLGTITGLTVGQTYFLRVYATSTVSATAGNLSLCLSQVSNYCNTGLGGSCGGNDITAVSISGTTLNATALTCTTAGGQAYTAYPATGANTGTLQSGVPYQLSVTMASGTIASVWIDYNHNLVFEASEWTQITTSSTGTAPTVVSLIVPVNAVQGPTGMRIRTRSSGNSNGATDACSSFASGETKDFTVTIGAPAACATPTGLAVSGITSTGASISFTAPAGVTSYVVTVTPAGGTATTITPAPTASPVVLTGLTASTAYTVSIASSCGAGQTSVANTITFNTSCGAATYALVNNTTAYTQGFETAWLSQCGTNEAPSANWRNTPVTGNNSWRREDDPTSANWTLPTSYLYSPAGSPLSGGTSAHSARFHSGYTLAGITGSLDLYVNMAGSAGTPTLTFDYINTSGTDSLSVLVSTDGGATFTPRSLARFSTASTWTRQNVNLPATGLTATTVIRFLATADYGSTDIGIDNVNVAYVSCPAITGLSATTLTATTAAIAFTPGPAGTTYVVTLTPAGGTATTVTPAPTTSPINLTGLAPNTVYTLSIVSNCGGGTTSQPSIFTFTTPAVAPANDDCAGAINVPVLFGTCTAPTAGTNVGATASTSAPAPANCNSGTGTANYLGGDIWFKVTVPASGSVTLETSAPSGPITDTGMAVYSGTCSTLNQIACDDDSSLNGLFSLIALTGRTPGEVLYVRVWEYGNDSFGPLAVCATSPSNCAVPTAPTASNLTNTTAQLNWSVPTGSTGTFEIEYGPQGFTPGLGTAVTGITGGTRVITGLLPNTAYCYYVRQNCGATNGSSTYVGPTCFTTPLTAPANNEPCGATPLGTAVVSSSNVGATTSVQNGINTPTCAGGALPKDVWFAFTPTGTSATLTLTGASAGAVRVFTSPDCSAGPFNQVFCQGSGTANTAFAAPVAVTGLTAGTRYYVAVSGFGGSDTTGPFTIAATGVATGTKAQAEAAALTVYPNPSNTGALTLRLNNLSGAGKATLLNALGQVVLTKPLSGQAEQTLATRGLATGLYTLRVEVAGQVLTRKVVLE